MGLDLSSDMSLWMRHLFIELTISGFLQEFQFPADRESVCVCVR